MVASSPRPTETLAAGENRKLTSADLPSLYDSVGKFDFEKAYPGGLENIHGLWDVMSQVCPDHIALADHLHEGRTPRELSFAEAARRIEVLAGGLQQVGVRKGDKVAMFAENSYRWALLDAAVLKCGAANVVRGAGAPLGELEFIFEDSESSVLVVETLPLLQALAQRTSLLSGPNKPRVVVVMFSGGTPAGQIRSMCGLEGSEVEVVRQADMTSWEAPFSPVQVSGSDAATVLYTSGTTGRPKGVVLTHGNLLHQIQSNAFTHDRPDEPAPGDTQLCILPCWHIFERMAEYFALARGTKLVYSSIRTFKKDLVKWSPTCIVAVPRLYENLYDGVQAKLSAGGALQKALVSFFSTVGMAVLGARRHVQNRAVIPPAQAHAYMQRSWVEAGLQWCGAWAVLLALAPLNKAADLLVWRKVRAALGGRVKCLISGGSKLPLHLDDFYELAGLQLIVGYGLTETSPVIANRLIENNVPGSVGVPPKATEISIRDVETGEEVGRAGGRLAAAHSSGDVGVVWARGPQVTAGYYKRPEATAAAFDAEGFFNTGDLGRLDIVTGALFLTGRAKDTIVLLNGENVEPAPLEEALAASPLVDQVMLVGQDEKALGALVVVNLAALLEEGLIDEPKAHALQGAIPATPRDPTPNPALLEAEAEALNQGPARAAVLREVKELIKSNEQFAPWEQVGAVWVLLEPFTMENGLMTQTLKVKRDAVAHRYHARIHALYKN